MPDTPPRQKTACLLVIGNEVLSGRTRDANLPHLAQELNDAGVRLAEARVIPDDRDVIVATVNECRARFDFVFTTGGIGPTHDDITSECIAAAFGVALERNPEALARLNAHYKPGELNENRLRMANIPAGGELIDNPISKAPGFRLENVYVMAGVPMIMQAMFAGIKHRFAGGPRMLSRTVAGLVPEGRLAAGLGRVQDDHPEVEVGSYPFFRDGRLGVSVVMRGFDPAALEATAADVRTLIRDLGGSPIEGEPGQEDLGKNDLAADAPPRD
ncbi:MAG: competence/damage-inducible protein A [Hyphomicrobiales bacterium]|nr:competence/damage-inducible protein A [Hyphomicrobiales bacterium]